MIWGSIGLLAILVAVFIPLDTILEGAGYRCGFYRTTGIPCPSCGATRAMVAAGSFRLGAALAINPLAACVFLALLLFVPYALVCAGFRTRRLRLTGVTRRWRWVLVCGAVLLVLGNWGYMILAHSTPR